MHKELILNLSSLLEKKLCIQIGLWNCLSLIISMMEFSKVNLNFAINILTLELIRFYQSLFTKVKVLKR